MQTFKNGWKVVYEIALASLQAAPAGYGVRHPTTIAALVANNVHARLVHLTIPQDRLFDEIDREIKGMKN
tara:strand:+ start:292 stop:501 length:210 start_codon:yes stop_codon:yes gene_type:complete